MPRTGDDEMEYAYRLPAFLWHLLLGLSYQPSALQYTDAIAIFDLLDIHLVHGWLVDPQVMSSLALPALPVGAIFHFVLTCT